MFIQLFAVLIILGFTNAANLIKLEVYYETHCPDTVSFILDQLVPTYEKLCDCLDLRMIPFGYGTTKKLSNGTYEFKCQHGPPECAGNLIQTCLLCKYPIEKALPMITCMEKNDHPELCGPTCAEQCNLDYSVIAACVNGREGNMQQYFNARRTANRKPTFIPFIGINNDFSQAVQDGSLNNLQKTICDMCGDQCPACQTT